MPQLVIQAEEGTFKFRFRDLRDLTFVRRLIVEPAGPIGGFPTLFSFEYGTALSTDDGTGPWIACATGSTPFSDQSHSGSLPNHLVSTSQPPPLRKLVSTIFGTSTHSRASMIPAYTPVIAPRYTSILLNACFMPSSTLTSLIGNSVCPPTMRSTSQLPSFQPPITGTSLGTCTLLLTTALAPMARYKCRSRWDPSCRSS